MPNLPEAQIVVLRKIRKLAPDFHRHIAASQIQGTVVKKGDRVLMYEIEKTVPDGQVLVTAASTFEFR